MRRNLSKQHIGGAGKWIIERSEQVFRWLEQLSRRRFLACALMAALPVVLRLGLLPVLHIPAPAVQDEFSYLLAAETYAGGHLTNPPHPMWTHFETFHEIFQPTYNSKYFPGQALFLALGWKLFGNPWYGVCISFGLLFGSLCWMLQGWMPSVYALLTTISVLGQITIFGYWMNSFWGGAVTGIGGCLVLGALPRLARASRGYGAAIALALGFVLLANTRPYEGLVMSIAALAALIWWRRKRGRPFTQLLAAHNAIPVVLICGLGAAWTGYYNYVVTGNPLVMPYTVYDRTYLIAPQFLVLPEQRPPSYRHQVIESYYRDVELEHYRKVRSNPLRNLELIGEVVPFYCSSLMLLAVVLALLFARSQKVWIALGLWACLCGGILIELRVLPHYLAAGVGLLPVVTAAGLRILRVAAGRIGYALVLLFTVISFGSSVTQFPDLYRAGITKTPREVVSALAAKTGGRHLIIVRYAPNHFVHAEYVYNAANIDKSAIVWARDMGETANGELLDHYRDRKVWLWQPDLSPDALSPYPATVTVPGGATAVSK